MIVFVWRHDGQLYEHVGYVCCVVQLGRLKLRLLNSGVLVRL
ncbi:MAG: hypothetical protein ACKERG_01245 [Candidatus Hodgkinia cicadicola]